MGFPRAFIIIIMLFLLFRVLIHWMLHIAGVCVMAFSFAPLLCVEWKYWIGIYQHIFFFAIEWILLLFFGAELAVNYDSTSKHEGFFAHQRFLIFPDFIFGLPITIRLVFLFPIFLIPWVGCNNCQLQIIKIHSNSVFNVQCVSVCSFISWSYSISLHVQSI